MIYRQIGTTSFNASVICLGTGNFGGRLWGSAEDDNAIKIVQTSLDHGINFIDTAPVYGYGRSEQIVGKAIKNRRDKVIVATKCGIVWNKAEGEFLCDVDEEGLVDISSNSIKTLHKCLSPESITEELEKSLSRLDTDYIDLYLTHWQECTTPIDDTVAALLRLKDQGKIRAIGVSNVNLAQLKQYGDIASAEEQFSMLDRNVEKNGILKYCLENNIAFLSYSPLCGKLLTGTMKPNYEQIDPRLTPKYISQVNAMLEELLPIAHDHNANLVQLVTAWTFSQPGVTHVLRGATTEKQAIENAFSGDISLSSDELKIIDEIIEKYEL